MEELELCRERVSPLPRRLQYNLLLRHLKRKGKKMKIIPRRAASNTYLLLRHLIIFIFFLILFQSP